MIFLNSPYLSVSGNCNQSSPSGIAGFQFGQLRSEVGT